MISPSQALSSVERLAIYANAYYARLLECLGEEFPVLKQTLGDETFEAFAFALFANLSIAELHAESLGGEFCRVSCRNSAGGQRLRHDETAETGEDPDADDVLCARLARLLDRSGDTGMDLQPGVRRARRRASIRSSTSTRLRDIGHGSLAERKARNGSVSEIARAAISAECVLHACRAASCPRFPLPAEIGWPLIAATTSSAGMKSHSRSSCCFRL